MCDLIPSLSEILLSGFEPSLNELEPYLSRFIEERDDINENVQMTGCLSQCFKDTPGFAANHAENFFKSFA